MTASGQVRPMIVRAQWFVAAALSALILASAMYAAFFGAMNAYVHRPLFLFAAITCTILLFPSRWFREGSAAEVVFNIVILLLVAIPSIYLVLAWDDMLFDSYLTPRERLLAVMLVLSVFEAARRTTAMPLIFVVVAFVAYAVYGNYAPGILNHAGVTWENALKVTVLGFDGIYGTPLAFAAGFVSIFVFFTSLLTVSGAGNYLLNLTFAFAGNWRGGPGKVAVLSSALMGMVTGSGITNVLTTGTITIPLMKRAGYRASFAGGVEAVASTGSQFVPPILGASAFLMAEYTNTPFILIAGYCLVPGLLYYLSVFAQVHFRSCKVHIAPPDEFVDVDIRENLLKSLVIFVPIVVLLALLVQNLAIDFSIAVALIVLFLGTTILSETRVLSAERIREYALDAARTLGAISVALALCGIVVGMLLLTGLGARLATLIGTMSGGSLLIALIMCAGVAIIVGMGVVTVGAYVIVASLTAPVLISLGMPLIVAHLFIFYFAVLSGLSPPVAVVIFAAAGIAQAPAMAVAWAALRLGFVAWLVPFMFAFYPSLIGVDGFTPQFFLHFATAIAGVVAFSAAFEGWAIGRADVVQRLLFTVGGIGLLYPDLYLSLLGAVFLGAALVLNWRGHRRVPALA